MQKAFGSHRKTASKKYFPFLRGDFLVATVPKRIHHYVIHKVFLLSKLTLSAAAILIGTGCVPAPSDTGDAPPASMPAAVNRIDNGSIAVGDVLELFVKEDPVFNNTYRVRERGDIIIPDVGRIQLKGLSVEAAERRIESYLEKGQIKDATVILDRVRDSGAGPSVAGAHRMLVYMTGAVQKTGQHVLIVPDGRPLGVYEAILIAGGLARFADEQKVHVLRMDKKRVRHRIPVNIRLIRQGSEPDPAIGQGDVIVVPEKVFGF
jgi:protein involved in polysaccharide export with SLBB domain